MVFLVVAGLSALCLITWRLLRGSKKKLEPLTPPKESYLGAGLISVIVPAYNEGENIRITLNTINDLAEDTSRVEVVLVDGGCKDNTMELVASLKLKVPMRTTTSVGGRGPAMNAGAKVAKGDLLLFVHADTVVPPRFDAVLREAFLDPVVLMTAFQFGVNRALLKGKAPVCLGLMERVTNYRTEKLHLPYGDQAFCLTAHKFKEAGGFPDFPIMEDFELVRKLRREELAGGGEIRILPQTAMCSPRRWEKRGNNVFKNFARNWVFVFLYSKCSFSPSTIFYLYYGMSVQSSAIPAPATSGPTTTTS